MKHLDAQNVRVLILSAGKIENELEKIFGNIPSGLIPLNGNPVIFRIIDKLLDEGFRKISITVGYKKEIIQEAKQIVDLKELVTSILMTSDLSRQRE